MKVTSLMKVPPGVDRWSESYLDMLSVTVEPRVKASRTGDWHLVPSDTANCSACTIEGRGMD